MTGLDLFGRPTIGDDGDRNAFDYYPTPGWMTRALLHHHPIRSSGAHVPYVLEPAAGDGAITRVLETQGCLVDENDLDPRHQRLYQFDARGPELWNFRSWDWVISNLPFNVAFEIVQHAVQHATIGCAFLLRKTWLEPTDDRGPWLQAHPPTRVIGMPRYSFRGTGSDSVSCDWFVWEKEPDRTLPPIVIDFDAESRR